MNSQEIREVISKIKEIEVQWDDRRKVISVFNFHNHKIELEALGFDTSSPMFANMTFAEEREAQPFEKRNHTNGPDRTPEWAMR